MCLRLMDAMIRGSLSTFQTLKEKSPRKGQKYAKNFFFKFDLLFSGLF